jgi:hypothetical protein
LRMRGPDRRTEGLFSYLSCASRVPAGHPLRSILPVADAALTALTDDFQQLYALNGRPSIAPEKLLRALLLRCCRRSTLSGRSANSWSNWPTTSCSAGLSGWAWTTRCGT